MVKNTENMVKLVAVYEIEDAEDIAMHLHMERIPCVRKKIGSGSYGNILLAMNNFGEEIFVNPEQEEEAKEVLLQWRAQRKQRDTETEMELTPKEAQEARRNQKQSLAARILAGAVAIVIVALFLSKMR